MKTNYDPPTFETKEIDFCMSKGRLSKKLVQKMIDAKNERIKMLEFMIENGLGWEDIENNTRIPNG